MVVRITVNGRTESLELDERTTLLTAIRDHFRLTGTKEGCDRGECGACTVLVDGRPALSCLILAVAASGRAITTIEGLATEGALHPVQQAFIDHDALQCGFCTPGQIMAAVAGIDAGKARTTADIREWMSGNLCRCAAYPQIIAAVAAVAKVGR